MSQAQTSESHPPGFYWHVHHEILLEWCYDYQERVDFIGRYKDSTEVPTRLRLFTPVRGTLPQEVIRAWEALGKARQAYIEARGAFIKVRNDINGAQEVFRKTLEEYERAGEALGKASDALDSVIAQYLPAIEALHRQEHPDCPWDGETIFPKAS